MEPLDEAKINQMDLEGEFCLEVFLSSDGKNTVHVKADGDHKENAMKKAMRLFDFLREVYGTKQAQAKKEYSDEEDLGKCVKCGAPNVRYKTSGKIGCSAYCWKK
jgi:hypothetical protein